MTRKRPRSRIAIERLASANFPIPEGTRCLQLVIPDDDEYARLIAGLYAAVIKPEAWQGDYSDNAAHADLMFSTFTLTDWEGCMDCSGVADCIDSDSGVKNSLQSWLSDNGYQPNIGSTAGIPVAVTNQNMLVSGECDDDSGWGHIRSGLVDRAFQHVQDVLERIELVTDNQEMLADTLEAIPVIGDVLQAVSVTNIVTFFDNVRAFLKDAFEAGDTVDLRDAIACNLFCLWQQDCSLSFRQVYTFFKSQTITIDPTYANAFVDMIGIIEAIASPDESATGEFVVYLLLAASFGFENFLNDWFGVHLQQSKNDLLLGEPSSDWVDLCDDCPEGVPYQLFNEPIGLSGSEQSSGLFTSGVAFEVDSIEINGRHELTFYATGDYDMEYSITPTPTTPMGTEICWLYTDLSDVVQFATGATEVSTDMPEGSVRLLSASNFKCLFWNGGEAFTVTLKLTEL